MLVDHLGRTLSAPSTWETKLKDYRQHLEELGRAPCTVTKSLSALRCFARFCQAQGQPPSPSLAPAWIVSLRVRFAYWTVRDYFLDLRTFLRWQGDGNPLAEIPTPPGKNVPVRPYSHLELRRLLEAAVDIREEALIRLLIASGMRANELVNLEVDDIDWQEGTVLIRKGKGGKSRQVAPGERTLDTLRAYMTAERIRRGYLFPGLFDGHLRGDSLYHLMVHIGKRAGIPSANVHRFRHTFAHLFLLAGGDVGDLREILGHSTIVMSLHYAKYNAAERALVKQREFNPMNAIDKEGTDVIRSIV